MQEKQFSVMKAMCLVALELLTPVLRSEGLAVIDVSAIALLFSAELIFNAIIQDGIHCAQVLVPKQKLMNKNYGSP